jgi:hypothetical protein
LGDAVDVHEHRRWAMVDVVLYVMTFVAKFIGYAKEQLKLHLTSLVLN